MSRFAFTVLAVAVTIFLAPRICAASKENLPGKVVFLEGGKEGYLHRSSADGNVEDDVFSGEDTAAAVAVLLGVPPPVMLSKTSSARLNSLLSSNPFKRPHSVVALTIKGIILESLTRKELEEIFGSSSFQQRPYSGNGHRRPFELSGQDVALQVLKNREYEYGSAQFSVEQFEQGLEALVSFLQGSYVKLETGLVMLKVPLPATDGFSISLDLNKKVDRSFAVELLSLFQCTQPASRLRMELQGDQNLARLVVGTFSALESMEEGSAHKQDAIKLFLYTAVRVVGALEATHKGQLVGVFTLLSITPGTQVLPMFTIKESRSSRFLLDDALAPSPGIAPSNQSLYDAEVQKLISRSLLFVTALILLMATGLGSCFLLFMPLTRDTLLYASVKLD